jgi:hypothetical protein
VPGRDGGVDLNSCNAKPSVCEERDEVAPVVYDISSKCAGCTRCAVM